MAKYHFDCSKCTNKYYANGATYCKAMVDSVKMGEHFGFTWDWKDGSGKNAEAWCESYMVKNQQMQFKL